MSAERLSSRWTAVYRVVLPVLWVGGGTALLVALEAAGLAGWMLPLAAIWLATCLPVLWLASALVHVGLEGDTLVVAHRRHALRIPLRDVERVSGTLLVDPELVWIRLRRPGALGSRLLFVPRRRGFRPFSVHPVVKRLEGLASVHQAPGLPPPLEAQASSGGALRAAALVALGLAALAALVVGGGWLLRSANPYRAAVEVASSHPELVAALGEPIHAGWPEEWRIRVEGERAEARFEIPLAGPRGAARLSVRAVWSGDEWRFSELEATLADGGRLDLLYTGPAPAEPPGELL